MRITDTTNEEWEFLRRGIYDWWRQQDFDFPWRAPDEEWKLLVTEILLVRTPPSRVAQFYEPFFQRFSTPEELASATDEEVQKAMAPLGLAKRAKYISQLGVELAARHGEVPETREELEALPGVGPYVAGAFLMLHRNEPTWFADSNVVRLLSRYFGFERAAGTYRRKWFLGFAHELFEHEYEPAKFGYAVLDFGREICSTSPRCERCPVREKCCFASTC